MEILFKFPISNQMLLYLKFEIYKLKFERYLLDTSRHDKTKYKMVKICPLIDCLGVVDRCADTRSNND